MLVLAALAMLAPASALAAKRVLRLKFDGPVAEAPLPDAEMMTLLGAQPPKTLHEWVESIDDAAKDRQIHGIEMIVENPQMSMAQLEEITRALGRFRSSGKQVFCYLDYGSNLSYALATAADHVTLAEYSTLDIAGLRSELGFYKGLLEKVGVQADMIHAGAYKAALEPYTRTEPSPEFAENINWLLDGIYAGWIQLMADGRDLSVSKMKDIVDEAPIDADKALDLKLVDEVGSYHDFRKRIQKNFGRDLEVVKQYPSKNTLDLDLDSSNPFALFTQMNKLMEEMFGGAADKSGKAGIGLIYIEGGIVVGKSASSPFAGGTVGSTTIRAALERARTNDDIKAVVLRVNSPGGSALASDIMWEAATRLAAEKPLIVSMGGVAGSGGYYVSLPADVIFAEDTTITASIGVVGGKMVWKELMEDKLGITTTEFTRGKNAALMSMNHVWTPAEREHMTNWLNTTYAQFKGRVMSSRGDRIKGDLEDLAAGRVFTGRQALAHGLVDRIGGLTDALKLAADKAGLHDYEIYQLPKAKELGDILRELMGQETEDDYDVSLGSVWSSDPLGRAILPLIRQLAPQQLRTIAADMQNLMVLNNEHVGCFMPFSGVFR